MAEDSTDLKEVYQQLIMDNQKLADKYSTVSTKLSHQVEASKQQQLQAETMGMMTKYQLVFVKMETAFAKVFNRNKLRDLKRTQDAFSKFRYNTIANRLNINCGSRIALENLKGSAKFLRIYEKNQRNNIRDAFRTWKNIIIVEKSVVKKKEELDYELDERKND